MRHLIAVAMLAAPALMSAQSTSATISPGMNHVQVVAALGQPVTSRTKDEYTYLYYQNGCLKECGMNDLVVLRSDSVVDAIFRSPNRHYTGTSSSPAEASPVAVKRAAVAPKPLVIAKPATPVKVEPKPAVAAAPEPAPAPAPVVRGTKTEIVVRGTNREVVIPGTKTEVTTPVSRMTPNAANDTKPSIPLSPTKTAP